MKQLLKILNVSMQYSLGDLENIMTAEKFSILKNQGIFTRLSDKKEIICSECDSCLANIHIGDEGKLKDKLYGRCKTHLSIFMVNKKQIETYSFNIEKLCEILCDKLKITPDIQEVSGSDIWKVGACRHNKIDILVFYYSGKDFDKIVDYLIKDQKNYDNFIVFTNSEVNITPEISSQKLITFISLENILKIQCESINIDKGYFDKYTKRLIKESQLINLPNFPLGMKWEDIKIRFLNPQDVIISVDGSQFETTYDVMGFEDKKSKKPNKQWEFLNLLAIQGGELSWKNNIELSMKERDKIKHKKKILADTLKVYFQIDSDPFFPYKEVEAYKIKINLVPEAPL